MVFSEEYMYEKNIIFLRIFANFLLNSIQLYVTFLNAAIQSEYIKL